MEGTTVARPTLLPQMDIRGLAREGVAQVGSEKTSRDAAGCFDLKDVSVAYSSEKVVAGVDCKIESHSVTALIGPSGCGKSTLLRCFNRMNDMLGDVEVGGLITLDGQDIYSKDIDPVELRMRVGQVFQQPAPFPLSIYDNVAYGPCLRGIRKRGELDAIVEDSLKRAALWDEVKDTLHKHAFGLSGGQQQRLCIARALATGPEVLLMDEPCSALDPISTAQIEETIGQLREHMTIVIVTHSMQQALRVSDYTMFMLRESMSQPAGLVESGVTSRLFSMPADKRTEDYITGHFG